MICGQIKVYVGQTQFYNSSVNEKKGSTRFVLLHVYNKYIVLLSCVLSYFWKLYVGQTQFYNSSVNEKKGSTRFVLLHVYNNYIVLM